MDVVLRILENPLGLVGCVLVNLGVVLVQSLLPVLLLLAVYSVGSLPGCQGSVPLALPEVVF